MSVNDSLVNWGKAHKLADAGSAKLAIQGFNGPRPNDFARVGSYNEGLEQIADLMADSALWLDAEYSGGKPHTGFGGSEPRVRNLGGGDRTGVSGAVIFGGKAVLPGVSNNSLTVPDSAALDLTGDLEMVVRVSADDWTPAAGMMLLSKHDGVGGGYELYLHTDGTLWVIHFNGAAQTNDLSTVANTFTDGGTYWLKATLDAVDGANRTVKFYWAEDQPTEPRSWTQLGANNTTAGNAVITTNTGVLRIGERGPTGLPLDGNIYRAIIRNGIGGDAVLDVDLTAVPNWTGPTFTAATGQTVTLNTTAAKYGAPSALDAKYGSVLGAYVYDGKAVLPGISGNTLSVPDSAALDVAGDLDVTIDLTMPHSGSLGVIVSKDDSGQRSWLIYKDSLNRIWFDQYDGTTLLGSTVTSATIPNNTRFTLRVVKTIGVGTKIYFDGVEQAYAATTTPTTALTATTARLEVGANFVTSNPGELDVRSLTIKDGGTTVLDVDLADVADYATSFTAATGQTVTVNSTASDTNDPKLLTHTGVNYAYFPGNDTANYLQVPDDANLDITGDLDVAIRCAADDWTAGANQEMWGKYGTTGNQRSWRLHRTSAGLLQLTWSVDGITTAGTAQFSSDPIPFSDGEAGWLRATLDVDNGAGVYGVTFYYAADSPDEPSTWTQLGTPRVGGSTTSIFSGTAPITIGKFTNQGASELFQGKVYRTIIRNGIGGTKVLDVNLPTDITDPGATSFTATSGQTVTVLRATTGRKTALVTRPIWLFGTDDYLEVADNALLDFGASEDFTAMACFRRSGGTPTPSNQILTKNSDGLQGYTIIAETRVRGFMGDGGANYFYSGATTGEFAHTENRKILFVGRDGTDNFAYANNTLSTGDVEAGSAYDMSNSAPLRVGSNASLTAFADMELIAVALFRRALTATEIAAINNYYGTI